MTLSKFLLLGVVLMVLAGAIRYIFHGILGTEGYLKYIEWTFIALAAVATSRRLGVINFLEAILAAGIWLLFSLGFDFLITSQFLGLGMFRDINIWIGYLVMALAIFWLHKKRHIHIRHQLHH